MEYAGLQVGGQLTQTTIVENFPGYPDGVDANQMMMELRQQAERFGADVRDGIVTDVDFSKKPYVVTIDNGSQVEADTIIVATGASAKYLGLPDEKKYNGQGVSACATCDGFFYRKKVVAVVGGGDTACEEANYLAQLASKVYMIVRKPYLRASDIMKRRVEDNPKIEILYETNTLGLYGENGVEGAHLVCRKGEADEKKYDLPIDGFFLAIGPIPTSSVASSTWTAWAISRPRATRHARAWRGCSPPAIAPTPITVRPLSPPAVVARLQWRPKDIWRNSLPIYNIMCKQAHWRRQASSCLACQWACCRDVRLLGLMKASATLLTGLKRKFHACVYKIGLF